MASESRDMHVSIAASDNVGSELFAARADATEAMGHFTILSSTPTAQCQNTWIRGIRDALEVSMIKNMPLVDIVYAGETVQDAKIAVENMIDHYPELGVVISVYNNGTVGAAEAITARGVSDRVTAVGVGMEESLDDYIGDACSSALYWDPIALGELTAYVCLDLVENDRDYQLNDRVADYDRDSSVIMGDNGLEIVMEANPASVKAVK